VLCGQNGKLTGAADAFEKISNAFFYPTIWIESPDTQVTVNFGQSKFAYDFAKTLPSGFLERLQASAGESKKSAAELRRRAQAEELVLMMGGSYPVELCEVV
jgi:hypothetical protein